MAINQITINLEDCEPVGGYLVFYRPVGSENPYRTAGNFFSSPIIFTDIVDPPNQQYEGYIMSSCGGGVFGDQIPWETEGSPSVPVSDECCDPVVLTAETETTIPDGSLPGSGSEPEVCCTPFIISACIETLDESGSGSQSGSESGSESGSGSGSGSESDDIPEIMHEFTPGSYASYAAFSLSDWNIAYNTAAEADTPFDEIILIPGEFKIVLKGCTNLQMPNVWQTSLDIVGFWDISGTCIAPTADGIFADCYNLEVVEMNYTTSFGNSAFFACIGLTSVSLLSGQTFGDNIFTDCTIIENISLPACLTIGDFSFSNCFALTDLSLPVCTNLGSTAGDDNVFSGITGNTITLTILTATATDGDVVTLQANNTVTLILV